jgi:hypothetical protein
MQRITGDTRLSTRPKVILARTERRLGDMPTVAVLLLALAAAF